jgi:hypothetical protein
MKSTVTNLENPIKNVQVLKGWSTPGGATLGGSRNLRKWGRAGGSRLVRGMSFGALPCPRFLWHMHKPPKSEKSKLWTETEEKEFSPHLKLFMSVRNYK